MGRERREGEGNFRGKFDIRNFARPTVTGIGREKAPSVCFPRTLSTSTFLLDSSRYSPFPACSLPSNSFYFSFLFLSFFLRFCPLLFLLLLIFFSLPPFYFRGSIERELASVFSLRTFSRSRLLRKRAIVSLNQPFVPRYVLTNLRSIIPLFDDLFINVNRKLFLT